MLRRVKKFDDRAVDFASGKKISPPRNLWKNCACCGLPIVKGWTLSNGDNVGEDCEDIISRVTSDCRYSVITDGDVLAAEWLRISRWKMKRAIQEYIAREILADRAPK